MGGNELIPRIGTFFLLVAFVFLMIFMASDFAKVPQFDYLFIGLIILTIGIIFRRKAAPPPSSGRFSGFRNFMSKYNKKDKKDEKDKK